MSLHNQLEDFQSYLWSPHTPEYMKSHPYIASSPTWQSLLDPAYCWLIIHEALRQFSSNATRLLCTSSWSILAVAFPCPQTIGNHYFEHSFNWGAFCTICQELDFSASHCTLVVVRATSHLLSCQQSIPADQSEHLLFLEPETVCLPTLVLFQAFMPEES